MNETLNVSCYVQHDVKKFKHIKLEASKRAAALPELM